MKDLLIGLDIGTSSVKAALFDTNGQLLDRSAVPISMFTPQPGWAEQDPQEWWQAALQALRQVLVKNNSSRVAAIGLSGQCPGHVLVGKDHQSLGRAIIWQDQRAVKEARWLVENIPGDKAQEWLGTVSLGDATCPPARLLWLKENRPQEWDQAEAVIQPKDYIALQLTGVIATDRYSAYCLGNAEAGTYAQDYFDLLGIPVNKMPAMLMPTQVVGTLTATVAQDTGLPTGTPVVIGTIDAYCDNLAGGISSPKRAVDVAGTSEILSLAVTDRVMGQGVFPVSLGGDVTFLCGPTQAGGDTLRWLSHCFFPEAVGSIPYEKLGQEAASAPAGSDGLIFLPYLNGERAPLWDAGAKAGFLGLTFQHERRHYCRAVYESVGYAIRHILETCEEAAGQKAVELVICGGGSRSLFWNQVKADILQLPVKPTAVTETGCLGAAILASVGCGLYPDHQHASRDMILFKTTLQPEKRNAAVYDQGYQAYRRAYPALKNIFPSGKGEED